METISQRKSAGRSGDGKHRNTRPESRRIGNERPENRRGAQPTEAVEKMDAARGANSLAAMPTPSVEDARETIISKTVLGNVDELMRSENGDAKRMVAKMPLKRQFQVIKALAHIYCTDDNYARNGKALTLICCTIGVGWEMLDGWRERYRNTGEIRFTDSEKDYIRARIAAVATEVARENGGVKT